MGTEYNRFRVDVSSGFNMSGKESDAETVTSSNRDSKIYRYPYVQTSSFQAYMYQKFL